MLTDPRPLSRRQFLSGAAATAAAAFCPRLLTAADKTPESSGNGFSFFVVSDTHYLADVNDPAKADPDAEVVINRFLDVLTGLPGSKLPESMGGGTVAEPV